MIANINQAVVKVSCKICNDTGWVCEDHTDKEWDTNEHNEICGAPGVPCVCNNANPAWHFVLKGDAIKEKETK